MRKFLTFGALLATAFALTACGQDATREVHIYDGQFETVVYVTANATTEAILEAAEITVAAEDTVTGDADEITIARNCTVTVVVDGEETSTTVKNATVADAVEACGVTLGANDTVDKSLDACATDGMIINVEKHYGVYLTSGGTTEYVVTDAVNVSELLAEQNIELGDEDKVSESLDASLYEGMELSISLVSTKEVVETEEIPYETTYENSSSLESGKTSVKQAGVNGITEYTYQVTYVDGVETSRELISEEVTQEVVDEIILKGTKTASSSTSGDIVSKEAVYDCDGSGHGYYIITHKDGSITYQDF